MNGRFRYRSRALGAAKAVLAITLLPLLGMVMRSELLTAPLFLLGAAIIILPPYISCSYRADEQGVEVKAGLKKIHIDHAGIMHMDIKKRRNGYSKTQGFIYENVLTIQTADGEYELREAFSNAGSTELSSLRDYISGQLRRSK